MTPGNPWKRVLAALVSFGIAFGYLEAAVVAYLRAIWRPDQPRAELFPILTLEQLKAGGLHWLLAIELGREAATLVMLAAVAMAVSRSAGQWAAAFAIAFGAWDMAFYASLKLVLDWPASLLTWDLLFLIPVPWVGPVLAPVIVSASMIACGLWHLWREARGAPVQLKARHWLGLTLGAAVIVLSFTLDYRNILAGGLPGPFAWWVFSAGLAIGLLSYALAARRN